jgi:hypothetical protein
MCVYTVCPMYSQTRRFLTLRSEGETFIATLQVISQCKREYIEETRREGKYFGLDCGLVILHDETCVAFCSPCTNGDV